jgi:hypothetical protein
VLRDSVLAESRNADRRQWDGRLRVIRSRSTERSDWLLSIAWEPPSRRCRFAPSQARRHAARGMQHGGRVPRRRTAAPRLPKRRHSD